MADKIKGIDQKRGFTSEDVAPEGFGPSAEIGKPVLEGLKGETLDQAIARSVGYQIDNGIVKLEETHDGWKATIAAGEGKNVFSATKKQSVLNEVYEFLNPGYKFRPAKPEGKVEALTEERKLLAKQPRTAQNKKELASLKRKIGIATRLEASGMTDRQRG